MLRKLISSSRYLILIAVISAFIAAITLLIIAGIATVQLVGKSFGTSLDGKSVKLVAVSFIEIIDILLLGTICYITSVGLYELFIDENLPTPSWLHITQIDDLKAKLIGVIVVILMVVFLSQVVNWDGQQNLLLFGGSIALVIGAATVFLSSKRKDG